MLNMFFILNFYSNADCLHLNGYQAWFFIRLLALLFDFVINIWSVKY